MSTKIKPLGRNILVKEVSREEKTSAGIVLTGESPNRYAEVVAVSSEVEGINEGDTVILRDKFCGLTLGFDGLVLVDSSFILCTIE